MTPSIDGKTHAFAEHGLYDGLFLMMDEETGTFWDHLTGEARADHIRRGVTEKFPS